MLLFLPFLLVSNEAIVACERFISREFLWNSRYLEQWYPTRKVSNWFWVTIVTCFYNKNKCARVH